MSYFAVLSNSGTASKAQIARCHVNLWVLHGLFGHRIFYLDVGLGILAQEKPADLSLSLPIGVEAADFKDLHETTKSNVELIFGEPTRLDNSGRLERDEHKPMQLLSFEAKRDESRFGPDHSVWKLEFPGSWDSGKEVYVRGRFRAASVSRNWFPQKSGAIVDLRVCDVRESESVKGMNGMERCILPIGELNLFAIVPSSLKLRAVSPETKHVRMLESSSWAQYLDRNDRSLRQHKHTVYYWRSEKGKVVDARNPYRAFLDLASQNAVLGWRTYLAILAIGLASALVSQALIPSEAALETLFQKGKDNLTSLIASVAGISIFAVLKASSNVFKVIPKPAKVRAFVRWLEDKWFSR